MMCSPATRYAFLQFPLFTAPSSSRFLLSLPHTLRLNLFLHSHSPNPNDIADVVDSFNRLLRRRPAPSIVEINKTLGAIVKMKHYPTAISLSSQVELFKGFTPSLVFLNILINCYCHVGQMYPAFSLLGKIFKKGFQASTGIFPNTVTYSSLIDGFCKRHQWKEVTQLLNHMSQSGINMNVITLNILMDAFCKDGRIIEAQTVFAKIMKFDLKPNVVSHNILIEGCCMINNVQEASEVLNRMIKSGLRPDIFSYTILIEGYCKNKRLDEAIYLFKEMRSRNLVLDTVSYNTLIGGLCKAGRISSVRDLLNEMNHRGHPPNIFTYNILLHALCKRQDLDRAIALFERIVREEIRPTTHTYNILMDGLCTSGRLYKAREIFQYLLMEGRHFPRASCLNETRWKSKKASYCCNVMVPKWFIFNNNFFKCLFWRFLLSGYEIDETLEKVVSSGAFEESGKVEIDIFEKPLFV
ncbi:hypothetical protein K1719_038014 [Acacia pycnantha]|nr:hypothetical protein K1719_038014 [Acacia pycnantha]